MLPPQAQVAETIRRFTERREQRGEPDSPERVQKRIARVAMHEARVAISASPAELAAAALPARQPIGLERILGKSDFMPALFLEMGARVSRAVCRIVIRDSQKRAAGYGTGFLVSKRLLMTNNHVLTGPKDAQFSTVELRFQAGPPGEDLRPVTMRLDPDAFFLTDPALDYSLVALEQNAAEWPIPLIEEEGKLTKGECVNIVQHPNGEMKQLALRENQVVDILENFVHYHTDTAPGSSGSPVFNDQWELVALHHSGVPAMDGDKYLSIDGKIWDATMGEHRIRWIANEGGRVSRLVRHIKAQTLPSSLARKLRDELFDPPAAMSKVAEDIAKAEVNGPMIASDGTVTWTVPVQISVRIGGAAAATPIVAVPTPAAREDSPELQVALDEAKRAKQRKYYDAAADACDAQTYYGAIDVSASKRDLYKALRNLSREAHTTQPRYKPAVHLYPWIDLQPNGKLRSVYSKTEFTAEELIREDFRIEKERATRLQERLRTESAVNVTEELDLLEALLPFNCEHVVPQSWFDRREPMRGDLHHLFACESGCNSFRSNTPYWDFPEFEEAIRDKCGKTEQSQNKFEPGSGKGAVARATLYFVIRYPGEINRTSKEYTEERLKVLLKWHKQFAVDEYERHRNQAIFAAQGNRNPLIDRPEWAEKIDFGAGLG
jgi:endonuclease I/V8-like Glu-specific endopeptidase